MTHTSRGFAVSVKSMAILSDPVSVSFTFTIKPAYKINRLYFDEEEWILRKKEGKKMVQIYNISLHPGLIVIVGICGFDVIVGIASKCVGSFLVFVAKCGAISRVFKFTFKKNGGKFCFL